MQMPMFPLGNAVLPGEVVPLRVFEPRYRRLVLDCLASMDDHHFGITLIERGSEVGGGDVRSSIGTRVALKTVAPLANGRFQVMAAATSRISVLEWLDDDPYPRADVEDWPDKVTDAEREGITARLQATLPAVEEVRQLAGRLTKRRSAAAARTLTLADDPVAASYQLITAIPLGPADRFRLLQAPSLTSRLDTLDAAIDDLAGALRFRLSDAADDTGSAGDPPPTGGDGGDGAAS